MSVQVSLFQTDPLEDLGGGAELSIDGDVRQIDLGGDWHLVHFLLCGQLRRGREPRARAVFGGGRSIDEESRYLSPEHVRDIAWDLEKTTPEELARRWRDALDRQRQIYGGPWSSEDRDAVLALVGELRGFYRGVADDGKAVVVFDQGVAPDPSTMLRIQDRIEDIFGRPDPVPEPAEPASGGDRLERRMRGLLAADPRCGVEVPEGPVRLAVEDLARLFRISFFQDNQAVPFVRVAVPEDLEPPERPPRPRIRVLIEGRHLVAVPVFEKWDRWAIFKGLAAIGRWLRELPNGSRLALLSQGLAASPEHVYTGTVRGDEWLLERCFPAELAGSLAASLHLSEEVDRKVWPAVRSDEEAEAFLAACEKDTFWHGYRMSIEGGRAVARPDPRGLAPPMAREQLLFHLAKTLFQLRSRAA